MDYTTSYFPLIVLYSEIDHIHLSIEAQCVPTLLPLGDCHTGNHHQPATYEMFQGDISGTVVGESPDQKFAGQTSMSEM